MITRGLYVAAALLLALALVGLRRSTAEVAHYAVVLPGGVPAVVYEPGPPRPHGTRPPAGEKLPVAVVAHGIAGSKGMMSSLARRLALAGYAVVTFDFRGHGESPHRFERSPGGGGEDVRDDLDAAVLYARSNPRWNGEAIALVGHSMGGGAALQYATREPSLASVVVVSGAQWPDGPYAPPNVLLIWASGDPPLVREGLREIGADLAGLQRLVLDRTYGEHGRGQAVRLTEVPGVNHLTILYSREAAARIVAWLDASLERPPATPPAADLRLAWGALGLVAFFPLLAALVSVLAPLIPRQPLAAPRGGLRRLAAFALAQGVTLVLLAAADPFAGSDPARWLPLFGARELLAFFATSGALLLVWCARKGSLVAGALARSRTLAPAAALALFGYLVLGSVALPFVDLWLTPQRLAPALLGSLLALPYFGASELLLRSDAGGGALLSLAGKAITLVALVVGALLGLLSFLVILATGAFAAVLLLLEFTGWRLGREAPNPWVAALVQSAWAGWLLAAVFPLTA